jgi:alkaline phosphatase D
MAAAMGAAATWASPFSFASSVPWKERRELFPEGVASGDPDFESVLLWTRYPQSGSKEKVELTVEVAEDREFKHVVASKRVPVWAVSDWTCRVLVGGLKPWTVYWYRFTDASGAGSRVGRTMTAPALDDPRAVRFVFVSCQNVNQGAQNAYRRMIYEDERAAADDRIGFVLHLGDFIYELVWYPEERPQGMYDRRIRDIVRYKNGAKFEDFHIPTDLDDYRAVYKAYLKDPDLQDARAYFPFVNMWDNHEFSWLGWQSNQIFDGVTRPAQTRKVAAMQTFFEYQPGRLKKPSGPSLEKFDGPKVVDTPITKFDENGFGVEPNNVTAIGSLTGYRALRWGKNVELIITDQRSYRSQDPFDRASDTMKFLDNKDFPDMWPDSVMEILDAGRSYNGGNAPAVIKYGDQQAENPSKNFPAQTILGAPQRKWFLERLKASQATWKVWGNTTATLDMRFDPQNLPAGLTKPWPGEGFATSPNGDHGAAYVERGEIYDFVAANKITGFATVAGDRHSFWAGYSAKTLPPKEFKPVGIAFVTGSISAPGMVEAFEHRFPKDHPLRPLFVGQGPKDEKPQPTVNMAIHHGCRSCLEYAKSGDVEKARAVSNPDLAPHVKFVDMGGHGYSVVRASSEALETEFVCIPRPLERSATEDGGPLRYRVKTRTPMWQPGAAPTMSVQVLEGDAKFSV